MELGAPMEQIWEVPWGRAWGFYGAKLGGAAWSGAGGVLWSCEVPCTLGSGFSTAPQHVGPLSTIPVSWGGTGVVGARHRALRG